MKNHKKVAYPPKSLIDKRVILPIPKPAGNTPHWLFQRMDWADDFDFSWSKCADFNSVLKKLGELEQKSWAELGKQESHQSNIQGFIPNAKQRLQQLKLDDYEDFFSFRLSGTERVWALRHGSCMLLLWWDPNHKVYPSVKKHT